MPWIDKNMCTGCEICIDECPVGAIAMVDDKAEINMGLCIRCGTCHKVCPENAARHDSELIPEEVENNIEWVKDLLTHYTTEKEKRGFLKRIKRHFLKEMKVNEKTLEQIEEMM
ncbi:MAG: 4Fe-4S dicluster domain-containing protein [Promethearchaeota archaeon]|nr:MAG: 4Fe-4S dicluster domain-containing protein [Candidatus Lokiarchaeota archaeon]